MAITAQQIIDGGFALSHLSRPELIGPQLPALVRVVHRTQQVLFQFAARVNPTYFAGILDVSGGVNGWPIPSDAESVYWLEGAGPLTVPTLTGAVRVVSYDDRKAMGGTPSVYRVGTRFFSAGNGGDPTGGLLRVFYARRPQPITMPTHTLDAAFPEAFVSIFEYEVAAHVARGDGGRDGELQVMVAERDRHITLFEQHLEHLVTAESRRFGEVRRMPTERREPLRALVPA